MKSFFLCLILLFSTTVTIGQVRAENVDIGDLMGELVITKKTGSNMQQVWVLPPEYWEIALADSAFAGDEIVTEIRHIFAGYVLVGTIDAEISPFGSFNSNSIDIQLMDEGGNRYDHVPETDLDEDLQGMVNVFKPAVVNMLGRLGDQISFFVFKNENATGEAILKPVQKGEFSVMLNETKFSYRTPFGAMVMKKICPEDGEALNGSWEFCPWHGKELNNKK